MPTLANSEDPDEMPHNAAFHQGLHYLLRPKQYSEEDVQFLLEIVPLDINNGPLHPKSIVAN